MLMKNILLVGDFLEGSGLTNVLINTYKYFPTNKYKISVLKYGGSNQIDERLKSLGWEIYSVTPVTKNPIKYFFEVHQFFRVYSSKFNIVHFNYSAAWNFVGVKFAYKYKIPKIIIHSHNTNYSKTPHFFVKSILNILNEHGKKIFSSVGDVYLATSMDAMSWMFDTKIIKNKEKYIFKNGIDVDKFDLSIKDRQDIRHNNNIDEVLSIGFMGILNERKNPQFAIKVFEEICKMNNSAKLFIFGEGPLKKELQVYLEKSDYSNRVELMGKTKEPNKWFNALDCLIFPSLNEGLPLVLVEAQTSGLLVIGSDSITNDVKLTENMIFESLENNPKLWAQKILDNVALLRKSRKKEISDKGFSAKEQSRFMENIINNAGD